MLSLQSKLWGLRHSGLSASAWSLICSRMQFCGPKGAWVQGASALVPAPRAFSASSFSTEGKQGR